MMMNESDRIDMTEIDHDECQEVIGGLDGIDVYFQPLNPPCFPDYGHEH